jgi:hypothetical protein
MTTDKHFGTKITKRLGGLMAIKVFSKGNEKTPHFPGSAIPPRALRFYIRFDCVSALV